MTNSLRLVALALLTAIVAATATGAIAAEPCSTETEDGTITCPHVRE